MQRRATRASLQTWHKVSNVRGCRQELSSHPVATIFQREVRVKDIKPSVQYRDITRKLGWPASERETRLVGTHPLGTTLKQSSSLQRGVNGNSTSAYIDWRCRQKERTHNCKKPSGKRKRREERREERGGGRLTKGRVVMAGCCHGYRTTSEQPSR